MNNALNVLRTADIWISSKKAALIVGRSARWIQLNKRSFAYKREGTRNLKFELSSVIKRQIELTESKSFLVV